MFTNSIYSDKKSSCWIHLSDLRFFLFLGANQWEKKIGQNIKMNLSLKINYEKTQDKLENTVDYGLVIEHIKNEIEKLKEVNLLEYLCEQILISIGNKFNSIECAKISIEKGYVPLENFTGNVRIEAEKNYFVEQI